MKLPFAPFLAGGLALFAGFLGDARAADGTQAAEAASSLTATVLGVNVEARQVEVLTAVGHAVRVVTVRLEPDSVIRVDGAPASLEALRPGRVVRIAYGAEAGAAPAAAAARAARTIETLPRAASSGAGR